MIDPIRIVVDTKGLADPARQLPFQCLCASHGKPATSIGRNRMDVGRPTNIRLHEGLPTPIVLDQEDPGRMLPVERPGPLIRASPDRLAVSQILQRDHAVPGKGTRERRETPPTLDSIPTAIGGRHPSYRVSRGLGRARSRWRMGPACLGVGFGQLSCLDQLQEKEATAGTRLSTWRGISGASSIGTGADDPKRSQIPHAE